MNITTKGFSTDRALRAQAQHYADVSARIGRCAVKNRQAVEKQARKDALLIFELRQELAATQRQLEKALDRLKASAARDRHNLRNERKLERLELDLADARARILSQAEMLRSPSDVGQVIDNRRTVAEIVAEVLLQFPGVEWKDVLSVRRTRDLIAPRRACMKAVYSERKDLSLPRIGKIFRRDHTTVLSAVRKPEKTGGEA